MATTRERRIAKELADIHNDKDNSGVLANPVDPSNLTHLKGTFPGPPDTPYAGGTYQIDIVVPDMYPFKSPIMKFDTKIWHPNVSSVTVGPSVAGKAGSKRRAGQGRRGSGIKGKTTEVNSQRFRERFALTHSARGGPLSEPSRWR